jgi:branched-chain amino acid transport system ATP-binding protein
MGPMTDTALETDGLNKRFGSLVVANDITLSLPTGARHALIGPNGAGKTTLINMITGQLRPDAGSVRLCGETIDRLSPHARVKRGLVRTFQITTLFPRLSPIEAVTLAVCERRGEAADWRRGVAAHGDAVAEAFHILAGLGLADDCTRETRLLGYGQQRLLEIALALATKPKVLLLDEPAAGVPRGESAALFAAIASLPHDISVLFIEHDMGIVFRFATEIIVLVGGTVMTVGAPAEIAADERVREVYLGSADHGIARHG